MQTWVYTTQKTGRGPAGPDLAGCLFGGLVALVGIVFAGVLLCMFAAAAAIARVTRAFRRLFPPSPAEVQQASPHREGMGKQEVIEAEFEVVERRPGPSRDEE